MYLLRILLIFSILLTGRIQMNAQEIIDPNFGLKSPETLDIIRVRSSKDQTFIDMSILNMREGGYFCIDENTFLEYGNGLRLKMKHVKGLPECPDLYEFSSVGEKVYFTLTFDRVAEGTEWFDIIEDCGDNCLSVLGVTLNEEINGKINEAFNAMDRLEPEKAIEIFRDLLPFLKSTGHGLTGSVYLNLAELLAANNLHNELKQLISDFDNTPMPHKDRYREILNNIQ